MSLKWISLANKWRPKNFLEFLGQNHIIKILKNSISSNTLHHSYLFSGPSGVGKTTLARIFSKCLSCFTGVVINFCEICNVCKSIDLHKFVDLIEIDAASNRGVNEITVLMENILYKPLIGRFKIYVIDEFHMLSNHAFSVMLKLLEEPPKYVKFILITTELDKIPITVLSRCMNFKFKNISEKNIVLYFSDILNKENILYKRNALFLIAKSSNGNIRDCFCIIQQCICFGKVITLKKVLKILCLVDEFFIIKLLFFIYKGFNRSLIKLCNEIKNNGFSFSNILLSLIDILYKIFLLQCCSSNLSIKTYKYKKKILYFSKIINPEKLQLIYQLALLGYNDLQFSLNSYIIFSMTLLRMSLFNPIFNFIKL